MPGKPANGRWRKTSLFLHLTPLGGSVRRVFPFLGWFRGYSLSKLRSDFFSGITVALVLIPQSMAYAQLAGLPPHYGLFAAFLPPMVASLFGSSRQLATGPVAVVSLMTATALEPFATAGSESFIAYAMLLALLVGAFQFSLGVLRLGLVVNFLSHPVVNGFTNAAALIIASSQLSKLFGVYVDKADHHYETIINVFRAALEYTHWPTLALAVLAFMILWGLKRLNPKIPNVLVCVVVTTVIAKVIGFEQNHTAPLDAIRVPEVRQRVRKFNQALADFERLSAERIELVAKSKEQEKKHALGHADVLTLQHEISLHHLAIKELKDEIFFDRAYLRSVHLAAVGDGDDGRRFYFVGRLSPKPRDEIRHWRIKVGNEPIDEKMVKFTGGGAVVGVIPRGLPRFKTPKIDLAMIFSLLPMAVIISLLGFMEAISIAKAMAAKSGQRLDPNQELIGQGLANIAGSFGQSYPVSGSFSRSAVNFQAGAVSGLSNVFSAGLVVVTLLFFTPLLYHLPQAVLAAIIMMAVIGLINIRGFIHAWQAQKHDGIVVLITFIATLAFAPHLDRGIFIGVALSVAFYLYRTMKPDIAILSKYSDGAYRASSRFNLERCKYIAVIRCNSSLFFANVNYLEEEILDRVASMPRLKHVHIVGNGINELDASGEGLLSMIVDRMREAGFGLSLSGLNDGVLDVMRRTGLYEKIGEENLYRSVTFTLENIYRRCHDGSDEESCPLVNVVFKGLPVSSGKKKSKRED
ncbi:MAG: SulP family inorganic anion transporter [Elusimicrobiota bacterium]